MVDAETTVKIEIQDELDSFEKKVNKEVKEREILQLIKEKLKKIKDHVEKQEYEEALEVLLELIDKLRKIGTLKFAILLKRLANIGEKIERAIIVKEKIKKMKEKKNNLLTDSIILAIQKELEKEQARKVREEERMAMEIYEKLFNDKKTEKEKAETAIAAKMIAQEEEEEKKKQKEQERKLGRKKHLEEIEEIKQKLSPFRAPRPPRPPHP